MSSSSDRWHGGVVSNDDNDLSAETTIASERVEKRYTE